MKLLFLLFEILHLTVMRADCEFSVLLTSLDGMISYFTRF